MARPGLDCPIAEIVKVEATLAAEPLPKVVQLLIDPDAEGVEGVSMADFVAMQPRRQLTALGGRKAWLEFLLESPYYRQVARLSAESPAYDLRALQQAGIHTLHQWAERPTTVKVSDRTRSTLDAAVEQSVSAYLKEVAQVVRVSNQYGELLSQWLSDVIGKFILDSLKISVESASAALHKRRSQSTGGVERKGGGKERPTDGASSLPPKGGDGSELSALNLLLESADEEGRRKGKRKTDASSSSGDGSSVLRPGEACTLEHYHFFFLKVLQSMQQDYAAQHAGSGDSQSEAEVLESTNTIIATALSRLLEQAVQQHLPEELKFLEENGYLALDRVPGLLRLAASYLQLRNIPVRLFVFHSTAEASTHGAAMMPAVLECGGVSGSGAAMTTTTTTTTTPTVATPATGPVEASTFAPGTFLCGSEKMNVTLGQWSGTPEPLNSAASSGDPVEQEYFSVLRRMRHHMDQISMMSIEDILRQAEWHGTNGFNASEALGLRQLFGPAKLVEDRLVSLLHYKPAASGNPVHFIEAGYNSGKSALLGRLSERMRAGERAVIVRYGSTTTPFIPGLDDHPVAFASRFWFRVALALCPYLIRTEGLFSRAPKSVFWWGNANNWSWEAIQRLIPSAGNFGRGRRGGGEHLEGFLMAGLNNDQPQLGAILVDDVDRVLDAMEAKWGPLCDQDSSSAMSLRQELTEAEDSATDDARPRKKSKASGGSDPYHHSHDGEDASAVEGKRATLSKTDGVEEARMATEARRLEVGLEGGGGLVGKTAGEVVTSALSKVTTALGQVDIVFTGCRLSAFFQTKCPVPVLRYFVPIANGVGLQQRLRVLPLLAVLNALHLRSRLEMPGPLYEVIKNCPGLIGKALDIFLFGRAALLDLHRGPPRFSARMAAASSGSRVDAALGASLLHSYPSQDLFAELPMRNYLLRNPRHARRRLVELLQCQLSSPSGYLTTGIDTTTQDESDGLVTPHNHTVSQVHPFALLTIFAYQDALLDSSAGLSGGATATSAPFATESKVVRAWAEVWAEYRGVVAEIATTPVRKRDAMRVLLHGALLLRSATIDVAQLDLNLKLPPYGFPLLATPVRVKGKPANQGTAFGVKDGVETRATTAESVKRAANAYKAFFAQNATKQRVYPFRPMVGLNLGCDVVLMASTTMVLYDIVTTPAELRAAVGRFAEALLGVLHVLERQVLTPDKVKHVQYVSVVSMDQPKAAMPTLVPMSLAAPAVADLTVPYFLDYHAVFEDGVMDQLQQLQEPLGIPKKFRTLNDLIDELERGYQVSVVQEVVASHEELESLFSPTLLQLVPDATVLPAYKSPVISVEDLMAEAMLKPHGSDDVADSDIQVGLLDADDDDRGDAQDALLEEEEASAQSGAEVDDIASDRLLSTDSRASPLIQQEVLLADNEGLHESAELLDALLNDQLDELIGTGPQKAAMAATAQELRQDLLTENALNYHAMSSLEFPATVGKDEVGIGASGGAAPLAATTATSGGGAGPQKGQREVDALAWLHEIIPAEFPLAGRRGSTTGDTNPTPEALNGAQEKENEEGESEGEGEVDAEGGRDDEETAWAKALETGGVQDAINEVFPATAARRRAQSPSAGAAARRPATHAQRTTKRSPREDTEIDIQKLFKQIGNYRSQTRKQTVSTSTKFAKSKKTVPRRSEVSSGGRRKAAAPSVAKGKQKKTPPAPKRGKR